MPDVTPYPKDLSRPARKPRKAIPARSPKRLNEADQRAEVRRITVERAGHKCQGPEAGLPGRCGWIGDRRQLETHEARQRSTHPGSHLSTEDTYALCPVHHDAVTSPVGDARVLALSTGLLIPAGPLSCEEDHR